MNTFPRSSLAAVLVLSITGSCSGLSSEPVLRIKIIDEFGQPFPGAKIDGDKDTTLPGYFRDPELAQIDQYTDENGLVEIKPAYRVTPIVIADGYYTVELPTYWADESKKKRIPDLEIVPEEPVVVQLHPEEPQVSVYTAESLKLFSLGTEFNPVIERGVKLYPDTQIVTTDRDSADLWFTFRHVGSTPGKVNSQYSHQRKDWQIQLKGLHGWSVMEQPEELKESQSRLAPDNGYRQEIEFSGDQVPEVIFLQQNGGERYGKLYDIKVIKLVMLDVMVQAHPSDTRSLNPGREEDLILD